MRMLREINHLNYRDESDRVYCERARDVITLTVDFMQRACRDGCPRYNGALQGEGVECFYADSTADPDDIVIYEASPALMKFRRNVNSPEEQAYREEHYKD